VPLIAIPNASTGSDAETIQALADAITDAGATLLDTHSDAIHDRSVFTITAPDDRLLEAIVGLAKRARSLDLTAQRGVHPRMGVLDICPFVPHGETTMDDAVSAARFAGELIAARAGIPVCLYGEAALRSPRPTLPELRRAGLAGLRTGAKRRLGPDFGEVIDDRLGVVCVGARDVLIAFNVWIKSEPETARAIARQVREADGGLTGVRALGFEIVPPDICQVSMNLTSPEETGIEAAFSAVEAGARARGARVTATEIVGLPPARFMPPVNARATRLLKEPGRSLEDSLQKAGL
jgi:glutamate formiminotransferase